MYCTRCGRLLNDVAKFCGGCGKATVSGQPQGRANQPPSKPVFTQAAKSIQSEIKPTANDPNLTRMRRNPPGAAAAKASLNPSDPIKAGLKNRSEVISPAIPPRVERQMKPDKSLRLGAGTRSDSGEGAQRSVLRASGRLSRIVQSLRQRWLAVASIAAVLLLTIIGIAIRQSASASMRASALRDLKVKDADDPTVIAKMKEIAADPATHALAEELGATLNQLDSDESAASAASSGVSLGSHRHIFSSPESTGSSDPAKGR